MPVSVSSQIVNYFAREVGCRDLTVGHGDWRSAGMWLEGFRKVCVLLSKHLSYPFSRHGFQRPFCLPVWIQLVRSTRHQAPVSHLTLPSLPMRPAASPPRARDPTKVPRLTQVGERALFRILAGAGLPGSQRKVPNSLCWEWRNDWKLQPKLEGWEEHENSLLSELLQS